MKAKHAFFISTLTLGTLQVTKAQLDPTFATSGIFQTGGIGNFASVQQQPDGKYVMAGTIYGVSSDFCIMRLLNDGTLDASFDGDGVGQYELGVGSDYGRSICLQTDGKIVVGGQYDNGGNEFGVLRVNADGTPDNTFGTLGLAHTDIGPLNEDLYAITIQSDGKIVAVGAAREASASFHAVTLCRYNVDGSPDASFGTGGVVCVNLSGEGERANDVGLQADGKIVVCGEHNITGLVARYLPNGDLDSTFGTDGRSFFPTTTLFTRYLKLLIQADGKIVVVGEESSGTDNDILIVRYNSDGTLDTSFPSSTSSGYLTLDPTSLNEKGSAILQQTDGKYLIAGETSTSTNSALLVRLNTDGSYDPTFGIGGVMIEELSTNYDFVDDGIIDASGKIVVCGTLDNYHGAARLLAVSTVGYSQQEQNSFAVSIWPNPANNIVQIKSTEQIQQITITNVNGQIQQVLNENTAEINVSGLNAGLYFLQIETKSGDIKILKLTKSK